MTVHYILYHYYHSITITWQLLIYTASITVADLSILCHQYFWTAIRNGISGQQYF